MEDYSEYIIQGEPDKRERVRNWMTVIGLQDVDDLKPSQYFLDTVRQNNEGKITLENELKNRYMIVGTKWEDNKKEDSTATQESTQETNKSTQEMILEEIRKHPFTTRQQLAIIIGITPDGIKKQLDKMKKANRIKHVGPTKGGHWEIITE